MNLVLSVYLNDTFKEYQLPSMNNADYSIILPKDLFALSQNYCLELEVLDHEWYIKKKNKEKDIAEEGTGKALKDGDVIRLRMEHKKVSLIVRSVSSIVHSYKKYCLHGLKTITIGKHPENDISCDYQRLVSRKHAVIEKAGSGYKIVNKSKNGVYVNSRKIETEQTLEFGFYINIMGLHMIFLGDILAIDESGSGAVVNAGKMTEYQENSVGEHAAAHQMSHGKTMYHRAPRNYSSPAEGEVEIEAPPQLNKTKQQSLFMAIGPSVTMTIPMLLGCMMMIYASRGSGGSSLYMYSGLVMAVSSAVIGVGWALIGIRNQKKEEAQAEAQLFEAYSEYLLEKTDEVKKDYQTVSEMLLKMYPEVNACMEYDASAGRLWNRNVSHKDFLMHRLGLGDSPNRLSIHVPKKRFTLYKNELAEKPYLIQENYKTLHNVPVILDLKKHNLIGIVGGKEKAGAVEVVRALSAQIAANNCYTDVKMGFIYKEDVPNDREKWEYAKWMPHVWSEDKKTRFMAGNRKEASEVFYELTKVFRSRAEGKQGEQRQEERIQKPYYILFLEDADILEGEILAKYVFDKENVCGLTTVLLSERYEELPNECTFIIENTPEFQGMYEVSDEQRQQMIFDRVEKEKLERFTRYLSTLQVLEMEKGGEIPGALTFFEMLNVTKPQELPVADLWAKNRTYDNIKGMVGQKAGGVPCYLDVHEKYHGPHGLVAGTTGSGKSETLQTYMLSLAVNYSPDDIAFFIIDYKGGGMANLFSGLPHLAGQISNLSGNQVKRAMISIKSENRRRQRIFTENGVNHINLYTKLYKNGEASVPIPHLFLIIDEFAELKREEPDFMRELISVAQVGRSLGVHLILATQKPSGTVDDNIWSNSKFRICLRVQDKQDSNDMLHKPDAAYITQAGRCYLQVGNDEVYELFQSGYSGAVYEENAVIGSTELAKLVNLNGKVEMTGNSVKLAQKKRVEFLWIETLTECLESALEKTGDHLESCLLDREKRKELIACLYDAMEKRNVEYAVSKYNTDRLIDFIELYQCVSLEEADSSARIETMLKRAAEENRKLPQRKDRTQLDAVKDYLAVVAKENGYHYSMQLWMPALGNRIYLEEFSEYRESAFSYAGWQKPKGKWSLNLLLGQMDDPANQNQMPLEFDFAENGHLAICGNVVSGKSTMMQTLLYALVQKYTPETVNIYAIDFSSKMMAPCEAAPHVGGVMYEGGLDKISKFFHMMRIILEERKALFRGGNYSQYVQVHGISLPAIVVFIDNYASFKEKTEEQYEEDVIRLSKEGVNHGIFLVISGNGVGMNDITSRVFENVGTVLCLQLQDKYAYADLLHSNQIDVLPESGIKGRGLAFYGKQILEYQTALAVSAENDYQRMEVIREVCMDMQKTWEGKTARRIPEIPQKPVWSAFRETEEFEKASMDVHLLPVAYDASNAEVYGIKLRYTYCYTIYGSARSGKTNLLRISIQSALEKSSVVCVIDSPANDLKNYSSDEKVTYASDEDSVFELLKGMMPVFKTRNQKKNQMLEAGCDDDEIFASISRETPYFIFISDLVWFVDFIYNAKLDMRSFLENIIAKGSLHNIYFIGAVPLENRSDAAGYPIYETFVGYKTGIHLGGKVSENPILNFDYMSYAEKEKAEKTGTGSIPETEAEEAARSVVIPLARR